MVGKASALNFLSRRSQAVADGPNNGVPEISGGGFEEGESNPDFLIGGTEGHVDAGTIDPVKISAKRASKGGRPRLTPAEREQRAKARAAAKEEKPVPVKDEPEPPPIDPTHVGQLAMILHFIHAHASATEMHLSEEEATRLATAIVNVSRYYVKFTVNNRGAAWLSLLGTAFMMYEPRVVAINARNRAARKRAVPPPPNGSGGVDNLVIMPNGDGI
jgi:hypothetical protein